jgi:hypothetical protein
METIFEAALKKAILVAAAERLKDPPVFST